MKDSGIPWLGEVPEHWEVARLGSVLRERGEINADGGVTNVLSVMRERGVIPYEEKGNIGNKKSDDITRYKVVRPNDIVVNCMNVIIGSVGLSRYSGCLSPVYYVLVRRSSADDPAYLNAYFQTKPFQLSLTRIGNGILAHRMRIPMGLLKCEPFPRPPSGEQVAIVRFLEYADTRIRRYTRNKQRLIAVLNEQKQAIIDRAVTRGVNGEVPLAPSGIEWLGEVPAHWQMRRLKYLVRNVNDQTEAREPGEIYLALEHIESWTGAISVPDEELEFDSQVRRFQAGDILFGKLRPYLAKVCRPKQPGVCVGELLVLRLDVGGVLPEFLEQKLRSRGIISLVNSSTYGAKMPRTEWAFIGDVVISYPVSDDEQRRILSVLDCETVGINEAITRTQREIALMREYRTRLIADVVTGKLDVRHIVADALPEMADGMATPDDLSDVLMHDELDDVGDDVAEG